MLCEFLNMFSEQINYKVVGNLNDTIALAAVGIGNMTINIVAIATIVGMNTALETRVAQAYGAGNLRQCGIYLNRGRIVLLCLLIPLFCLLSYADVILIMLHQDPAASKQASLYISTLFPGVICFGLFDANRVFLNALNYTYVPTLVQLIGVPLHVAWAFYLVNIYGMIGVCYAHNITYFTLFISITIYTHFMPEIKQAWFLPTRESFSGIQEYLMLGIPGSLMMFLGWMGTCILPFYAGLLSLSE